MNKMSIQVVNFTKGNEERLEGYSKFAEYYESFKNGKTPIGQVSFTEMNEKMKEFAISEIELISGKKLDGILDVAQYANFTDVKEAAFAILGMLTDLVMPDALIKDTGAIAVIKSGTWGDSFKIDMQPRDLFVVSKGGRSKRSFDVKRQFKGTATLIPEARTISVGISLYDILTGKYTLAEFVMKAVQSLEVNVRYDIYDAFSTAMNTLATSGDAKLKVTGYAQDDAVSLAQKVTAWNGGRKAIFLGTKLALSKILPASTNYRFNLGDDYVRIGHLRDFFGFDVVELEQIADYTTEFKLKLKDNEIYIISPLADKIVKVFFEGSTLSNVSGNFDHANLQVEGDLIKSYAVGVATSAIGAIIVLS